MRWIFALLVALAVATSAQAAEPPRATVESGELIGEATPRAQIFRGVPFAAPPVGRLRWTPPQAPTKWDGARAATRNGPSCPQAMNADGTPNFAGANGPTSEDCLQLNVFAPLKTGEAKAPVMVWLHGGGHAAGAGWIYDGQAFAEKGVIVVAPNYRLGALGYFAHPALTRAAGPSEPLGDYGLMDQIAALRWVRRNIEAFGGDAANVTVFGESAGGASVLLLLATPAAKGLFQKAVVQSGGGWGEMPDLAAAEAKGLAIVEALGLPADADAAALRALPAERLATAAGAGPLVDGRLVRETPAQAFAAGRETDVAMIVGANSGEDSLLGDLNAHRVAALAAKVPPTVRQAYAAGGRDEEALVRDAFGDRTFVAPARWLAAQGADGAPTWLYHFSYVGSRFRPAMTRAAHAADVQYVFHYWGRRTPLSAIKPDDVAMAELMNACWASFAKTGAPACPGHEWPAYDPATDQLLEFGAATAVRTGFRKLQLDAQEAVVLPKLGLSAKP